MARVSTDVYACAWVAVGRDWCPAEALDPVRVRLDGRLVELWCCPEHADLLRYAARREVTA